MNLPCPYCNAFKQAFDDNNYCSIHSPLLPKDKGNTFYVKAGTLSSGWHRSRMSFRAVLSGYQRYRLQENDREALVSANNYLLVNKGQEYCNEIDSFTGAESLIIAFREGLLQEVWTDSMAGWSKLLDNGTLLHDDDEVSFYSTSYQITPSIRSLLNQLKAGVLLGATSSLFYDELHYDLAEALVINHSRVMSFSNNLNLVKKSTRHETYRRLNDARDFMIANFHKKLDLQTICKEGAMSPYHFLKAFKAVYHQTPLEFLTAERIQYAKNLMSQTDLPVNHVTTKSGFENTSSFIRLFKRKTGITPKNFRLACRQS